MAERLPIRVVEGLDALRPDDGPLFAVVGVFDGLHLGHRSLLDALVREARVRDARPAVVTFDSHPDEILVGTAPPLLLDPAERLAMLAALGVEVAVVVHFDAALRATAYDAFVARITDRTRLAGLLMTPDAAFGHERRGTPDRLAALGAADDPPWDVVVAAPVTIDRHPVSSSEIRRLVAAGELAAAARLLGRPYAVFGQSDRAGRLSFPMPVALPPPGSYTVAVNGGTATATIEDTGAISLVPAPRSPGTPVHVQFG